MHIDIYVIIPKDEYYGEPLDYMLEAYLQGLDYINSRTEPTSLNKENIEILKSTLEEDIEEYNEHVKKIIEEYEKCKDDPEIVYFNTDLRYHINVISTGHILTHQLYIYEEDAILPLTKEKLRDILRNPEKYLMIVYDVHY